MNIDTTEPQTSMYGFEKIHIISNFPANLLISTIYFQNNGKQALFKNFKFLSSVFVR